jgi:Bcr/CflA subfamily drug resistance transporter
MPTPATPAALDGMVDQPSPPTATAPPESSHTAFRRFLLIALTAIGPISFQIFLPSLPAIQTHFGVSTGTAQLALSLSMLGIAVATLAYGSLSDRFGRRPVMLAGMAVLLGGSLVCALASSIEMLIVGRIVQAAGGAAGMVVTRAIVLDLYGREGASRVMAELMAAMMVAPMLATPLGGLVNDYLGWRVNFLTIALAAAGTLALVVFGLGETRRPSADARPESLLKGYRRLFASATFDGFACQGAFAMAAFITFMTAAPTYLTGSLGISATAVGFNFVAVSAGFMAGSLLASRMPKASRPERPGASRQRPRLHGGCGRARSGPRGLLDNVGADRSGDAARLRERHQHAERAGRRNRRRAGFVGHGVWAERLSRNPGRGGGDPDRRRAPERDALPYRPHDGRRVRTRVGGGRVRLAARGRPHFVYWTEPTRGALSCHKGERQKL